MIELCALLLAADERCLAWPLRSRRAVLPYWQLLSLQLLVLTPYFYGGLAKLNRSWLLDAEPVRTWADEMLGSMDDASGGHVAQALEHLARGATDAELLTAFAFFVSYAGLLIDLLVPLALLHRARWLRCSAALVALGFHACNRLWFGLGVFPYLCVLGLSLFLVGGQREWTLIPETDTALHPAQAGFLPVSPTMLLTYAQHLQTLYAARGVNPAADAEAVQRASDATFRTSPHAAPRTPYP
ncbi:hypothetical protein Ctob_002855 [Chrysochromulina tobinii]|uniref:HTTM domain-containing protein n=1 Tax=Chrysochromulina tobinii TaxID=1460289 RepID=A0A0M0JKD0_9EUKA|nr:hypothetical protein Ctob_002855 [Chrysochromulina tobinii]|eukprot:KOO27031.1 hypothetical protein Ctob_002855 [Chrysochromulina sp. CCMP291]